MKIVIISNGLEAAHWRLQPYRTLLEMGRQLRLQGHEVALISNGGSNLPGEDQILEVTLRRVPTVRWLWGQRNDELAAAVEVENPDLLFWHLSLTGFLHQEFHHEFAASTIGVVTSPIHRPSHILRLGLTKVLSNIDLAAMHLAGALVPGRMIGRAFSAGGLRGLITLSEATRQYLIDKGADSARVWVVPPGVDTAWLEPSLDGVHRQEVRQRLGFADQDFVVAYFGSPAPVRGLHTLVRALKKAAVNYPHLRLLILSRQQPQWAQQVRLLQQLIKTSGLTNHVTLIDAFLPREELIAHVTASDVVCLPFELLPSDVPLTVLEAMALRRLVITTTVASLTELAGEGRGFLVPPGSVEALAGQMEQLAGNPELAAAASAGRQFVKACRTWPAMGAALQRVVRVANGS